MRCVALRPGPSIPIPRIPLLNAQVRGRFRALPVLGAEPERYEGPGGKWERLWVEGEKRKLRDQVGLGMDANFLGDLLDEGPQVEYAQEVRIISFDLDNCLWPTGEIIRRANDELDAYLQEHYPAILEGDTSVTGFMKQVWKEQREANPDLHPSPIQLTSLRKEAIHRASTAAGLNPDELVEPLFQVWSEARHDVEDILYPGVLETLRALKNRGIRLCAITNGNAVTDRISCLADVFEFCVNAEEVNARKPDSEPFQEAVRRAGFGEEEAETLGGKWVHVGDDIETDCIGAKGLSMRTILVRPPHFVPEQEVAPLDRSVSVDDVDEDDDGDDEGRDQRIKTGTWSSQGDKSKTSSPMPGVVTDGYLSDRLFSELVDAECLSFAEVIGVVDKWQQEHRLWEDYQARPLTGGDFEAGEVAKAFKFCSECGEKLKREAKFCVECGAKQEMVAAS